MLSPHFVISHSCASAVLLDWGSPSNNSWKWVSNGLEHFVLKFKIYFEKYEYISFTAKPTNVFKYTGLSFSVIVVVVSNLHIFVLTFRLEDQKWHKDLES